MQKQKAATVIDHLNPQPTKMRKIDEQSFIPNASQSLSTQLTMENPLANSYFNPSTETAEDPVTQSQLSKPNDHESEQPEIKDQIVQAHASIKSLRKSLEVVEENSEEMRKCIEGEIEMLNQMIEGQKNSQEFLFFVREQIDIIKDSVRDFEESREQLSKIYDTVILKQEETNYLEGQFNDQVLNKNKALEEQLQLKIDQLFIEETKCKQLENEIMEKEQIVNEIQGKRGECEKTIYHELQLYSEEKKKIFDTIKDMEVNLNIEREENFKLVAENKERSKSFDVLLAEYKALQVSSTDEEAQIESLRSSIQEVKEKEMNLKNRVDELKREYLEKNSEKDLESANYRQQLQDLLLKYTEITNKTNEINLNNDKLSDTVAKAVQANEEEKTILETKDEEITRLSEDLSNILKTNEELSVEAQSLNEELIGRKELVSKIQADLDTCDTEKEKNDDGLSEMRKKVATLRQQYKDKCDDVEKLHDTVNDEKIRSSDQMKHFKLDIKLKNEQLTELENTKDNLQAEKEHIKSEHDRKLQQTRQLSMRCQKVGHVKQIKELNMKIDVLRQEISTEQQKNKLEDLKKAETDRKEKEKRETQLKDIKSNIANVKARISETKEKLKNLIVEKELKKARTSKSAKSEIAPESLNSSDLLGMIYTKHESVPATSTPLNSPLQDAKAKVNLGSFSDLSSIHGSEIFEEVDRQYAEFIQSNRTDNAKLNKPDETDRS